MTLDPDDHRLLRYLTAQRDDERVREQGRRARRKFNQSMGNSPFTSPAETQVSHAWQGRDPTAERAIGRADRRPR
jgi:hypothetical protein